MPQPVRWKNIVLPLLRNALVLLVVAFSVMIVSESALPFFLTGKIPFSAILVALVIVLVSIVVLEPVEDTSANDKKKPSRRYAGWLLLGLILLAVALFGSTLRYGILSSTIIATMSVAICWYLLREEANC